MARFIYSVTVEDRDDGVYLFENYTDQQRFAAAVRECDGEATLGHPPVCDSAWTDDLIAAERAMAE